jgi:hypothetical protein
MSYSLRVVTADSFGPPSPKELSPNVEKHPETFPSANARAAKDPRENEQRKLLQLLLSQLESRKKPPSVFETQNGNHSASAKRLDAAAGAGYDATKLKPAKATTPSKPSDDSDDDEITPGTFTADETYRLIEGVKDVILKSYQDGFKLFDDAYVVVRKWR